MDLDQSMRQRKITRDSILHAAARTVRQKGLAGATTRAIVQAVPCAEGTLYLHFRHRAELILAVIENVASAFTEDLAALLQLVGRRTVERNLAMIVQQAGRFQDDALALFCGIVSDPDLLQIQRTIMRKANKGPHLSQKAIAKYLEAEKRIGRVDRDLDTRLSAAILMRASFGRVFEERFNGRKSGSRAAQYNRRLIAAILSATDRRLP